MREIKFRAWDGKKMDFNDIFIRASGNPPLYEGKERPDLVLMQYTGLKDKNGKECFECDKVKNRLSDHHGTVIYINEFAAFNVVDENDKWVCSMGAMGSDGFEITGNIYES
jgi:uncharacterized phage protein (TIGR01671 family)